jgi:hypothetical protein
MELDVAREDRKESVLWWKKKRENPLYTNIVPKYPHFLAA